MKFVSDTKLSRFLSKLATVAKTGSYNDLTNKPTIPSAVTESTVSGWGFTKNTGTYSKPSTGIPKTDLASAVQTSLGKADSALQSFTETDPTVPSWAKASSKPTYTASEVGARPDTWTPTKSDVGLGNVGNFKAVSTVASQGLTDTEKSNARANIGAGTSSFSGSYNDLSNKPTIPSAVTESTVSGWGFTKNTGTYSKPSAGIPKTDLASAVQTSLGKADSALQSVNLADMTNWQSVSDATISNVTYHTYWQTTPTSSKDVYGLAIHPTSGILYCIRSNKGTLSAAAYNANTNTQVRLYKDETGTYPIVGSRTAASSVTSGSTSVYGEISGTNAITMTPSTGTITATTFSGTATKATQDSDGNAINTTYAKKSSLATVATSGSYNDLSNKPTIPVVPTLATVATSGSYNDLSNKPSIPTVNNATLTIKKDGTSIGTFTANASSNKTIDIVQTPIGIDTTRVLASGIYDYTATEDCYCVSSVTEYGTTYFKIDGVNFGSYTDDVASTTFVVLIKKGQVISKRPNTTNKANSAITAYGLKK